MVISSNSSPSNKILSGEKIKQVSKLKKKQKKDSKRKSETNEEKIKIKRLKREKSVFEAKTDIINKMIDKIKTLVEESEDRENETDGTGDEVKETF